MKKYKAIDLFSGCGGLTLGLRRAGFKVVGALEIDKRAVETYRANHPDVKVLKCDIRNINGKTLLKKLRLKKGQLDLLAGCPPCQGFSRIRRKNRRKVVIDDRNDLVIKFRNLIIETAPKAVMMENVPGLEKDKRFLKLIGLLRRHGYKFSWDILNVADYGVPQRRRRLVLLGSKKGRIILDEIKTAPPRTVFSAIGYLESPQRSKIPLHRFIAQYTDQDKELIRNIPKNGGGRKDLPKKFILKCHKKDLGFRDIYGRMAWNDFSPTITGGCINPSKGRFLHPTQNRAITLYEAALLQSFPKKYKFFTKLGRYPNAEMIGNALPPRFAGKVARYIYQVLKNHDRCL
jgi:DNA (cytosine-5)-methyltransferase 1